MILSLALIGVLTTSLPSDAPAREERLQGSLIGEELASLRLQRPRLVAPIVLFSTGALLSVGGAVVLGLAAPPAGFGFFALALGVPLLVSGVGFLVAATIVLFVKLANQRRIDARILELESRAEPPRPPPNEYAPTP